MSEEAQVHPDDKRLLELLASGPSTSAALVGLADDRRLNEFRVNRWLAQARKRDLIDVLAETDHLGREIGPRSYALTEKGARLLNRLHGEGGDA